MGHFGGLPFEQVTLAHPNAIASSNDGIDRNVRLVRHKSAHHDRAIQIATGFTPGAGVASQAVGGFVSRKLPVRVDVLRFEPATASSAAAFAADLEAVGNAVFLLPRGGLLNTALGTQGVNWLQTPSLAMLAVAAASPVGAVVGMRRQSGGEVEAEAPREDRRRRGRPARRGRSAGSTAVSAPGA